MQIRELSIPDSYEITPRQFDDDRGTFLEWYRRSDELSGTKLVKAMCGIILTGLTGK